MPFRFSFNHALSTVVVQQSSGRQQARTIHTSKKKVVVESKGRSAPKTKTIITSRTTSAPAKNDEQIHNNATRKSSRAKPAAAGRAQKSEAIETQTKPITNGTASRRRNQSTSELSIGKTMTVSDLDEIMGSPVKGHSTGVNDAKPSTRSSKRLSGRNKSQPEPEPVQHLHQVVEQPSRSSNRLRSKVVEEPIAEADSSSDESQTSQDSQQSQVSGHTQVMIRRNHMPIPPVIVKQEREVSYTMTDMYTCEMCSAVFSDRSQLLMHVPIHI